MGESSESTCDVRQGQQINFEDQDGLLRQSRSDHLADKLCDHSRGIFDALNHGQTEDPVLQMLIPDFRMVCEKGIGPFTLCEGRDEFVQHFDDMLKGQGYHFNVANCTVDLTNSNRKAAVMLTGDVGGMSVRVEVVSRLSWEFRKVEGWVCCRGKSIRALSTDSMRDLKDT